MPYLIPMGCFTTSLNYKQLSPSPRLHLDSLPLIRHLLEVLLSLFFRGLCLIPEQLPIFTLAIYMREVTPIKGLTNKYKLRSTGAFTPQSKPIIKLQFAVVSRK